MTKLKILKKISVRYESRITTNLLKEYLDEFH